MTRRKTLRVKGAFPKPSRAERLADTRENRIAAILRRGELRHDVIVRARGQCENSECRSGKPGTVFDHWLGGRGRRTQQESLKTVWMLCIDCNEARTANTPSAGRWNQRFQVHCERHRYPFVPHITRYELAFGPKERR